MVVVGCDEKKGAHTSLFNEYNKIKARFSLLIDESIDEESEQQQLAVVGF